MSDPIEIAREIASRYKLLPIEPLQELALLLEPVAVKKGDVLLNQGQVLRHMIYVESGLLRQFYYKKGKDITEHFGCEGTMVSCYHSLFEQQPTELMVEALEDSFTWFLDYQQLCLLCERNQEIGNMYRRFLELDLMESQDKADSWRFETARERYDRFIKDYPQAAQMAPIKDIASYLLMAPESLSRVRGGAL